MRDILLIRPRYSWAKALAASIGDEYNIHVLDAVPRSIREAREGKISVARYLSYSQGNALSVLNKLFSRDYIAVIIAQRLDKVSEAAAKMAKKHGQRVIWCEAFFCDHIILDDTGLQYTPESDLDLWSNTHQIYRRYPRHFDTREAQSGTDRVPAAKAVIFQQVLRDKSLIYNAKKEQNENPEIDYKQWVRNAAESIDGEVLVKQHPKDKTRIALPKNARYIDAPCSHLFRAAEKVIAYSSTVIYEAAARHNRDITTGGLHLMRGVDLSSTAQVTQRHQFLWEAYTVDLTNRQRFIDRITSAPEEWYKKKYKENIR